MFLKELCEAVSPSGYENDIRNLIKSRLDAMKLNYSVDKIGNILVHRKSKEGDSLKKVLLSSHMDSTGIIVTAFNSDGTLRFLPLGHIDEKSLYCKPVIIGENRLNGVIGLKPIHLQTREERKKTVPVSELCIDIGSSSEKESREYIELGDFGVFDTEYKEFENGVVEANTVNDRMGCMALLDILEGEYNNVDLYVSFDVQQNVGRRGAIVANYNVRPDVYLILDTVFERRDKGISLGKGPIIPYKFGKSIFEYETVDCIRNIAEQSSLNYQREASLEDTSGLVSVNSISYDSKICAIFMPCRYMNSVVSACSMKDYDNVVKILAKYLESF